MRQREAELERRERELSRRLATAQQAEFGQRQAAVLSQNKAAELSRWRETKEAELEKVRADLELRGRVLADQEAGVAYAEAELEGTAKDLEDRAAVIRAAEGEWSAQPSFKPR